ncbi:Inner membrane protein yrbG [Dorea longicatena]|nr:Inner membrane protein yrbG [Dorea longicatena]
MLGSNIFNLLVVLGCCALVKPVAAKWSLLKKEFPFSILITIILLLVDSDFSIMKILDGNQGFVLGRWAGLLFLILFVLVTSVVAARKGENDLAVGNVVGSNIFNILLILGVSSFITPITLDVTAVYDTIILIIASIVVYVSAISKREIQRKEGILFLVCYFAFFLYVFMR